MPADTRQLGMPTAAPDAAPSWRLIDLLPGRTPLVSAASVIAVLLLSLAMILMMLLRPSGMIPARARYCHDRHLSATLKQEAAK